MKFILVADKDVKVRPFFPPYQIGLFILIALIILFMFKPRDLLSETLSYHKPAGVILGYLKSYAYLYHDDPALLFPLVYQEIGMGQLKDAKKIIFYLKQTESHPTPATQARLNYLDYLLVRNQVYKAKLNSPIRIAYLKEMLQRADKLNQSPLDTMQLQALAQDYLAIGEAKIAMDIYKNLLAKGMLMTPQALAEGGKIAMQNNAHQVSAQLYLLAYEKATMLSEKRKYAVSAMKALWAGNYVNQALALGQKLPEDIIKDKSTLLFLSRLALAANNPVLAEQYVVEAITLVPKKKYEKQLF